VVEVPGMIDAAFGRGDPRTLGGPLHGFLDRCRGSSAVLAFRNTAVFGLQIASGGRLSINEGADFELAYTTIEKVALAGRRPDRLCRILVDLLGAVSTGMTAARRTALRGAFTRNVISVGRNQLLEPFMRSVQPIYDQPSIATFCEVVQQTAKQSPEWLTIRYPKILHVLGQLRPTTGEKALNDLDAVIGYRKIMPSIPSQTASTIHKAKGMQFDNVMIAHLSASHFPDSPFARRLAYVAISRACRNVELLVPALSRSPLLG
jgi:hypothetical protein